jgi:hypothetical protein
MSCYFYLLIVVIIINTVVAGMKIFAGVVRAPVVGVIKTQLEAKKVTLLVA